MQPLVKLELLANRTMHISKITRAQSRAIDQIQQYAYDKKNPKRPPQDPAYRHMQNIVDKAKRGEKL